MMWVFINLGINKIDVEMGIIQVFNEQDGFFIGEVKYLGLVDSFVLVVLFGGIDIFFKRIVFFVDFLIFKLSVILVDKDILLDQ